MGLEHLIRRSRVVQLGGSAFVCYGPSVATVYLTVCFFGKEILAAREVAEEVDAVEALRVAVESIAKTSDTRLIRVLETCVEGDVSEITPFVRMTLVRNCFSLFDARKALDSIDLPEIADAEGAEEAPPEELSQQSQAVVMIAQRFGLSPHEVMDWPYNAFTEALAVLNESPDAVKHSTTKHEPSDKERKLAQQYGLTAQQTRGFRG